MMNGNDPRIIVLAGFMGTGKSTVGRLAADRLGFVFVDSDAVIEARAGRTIAEIFRLDGEPAFRRLEAEICHELAALSDHVIAAGGGALLDDTTRRTFETNGVVIGLTCDLDTIIQRVGDDPARPLFSTDRARLAHLFQSRAGHYASLPHAIDTTHLSPEQAVEEVIGLWHQYG